MGTCFPVCRGQRTNLDAMSHLPPCLRKGLLFITTYARVPGLLFSGYCLHLLSLSRHAKVMIPYDFK